jgi:hypothetical protein
MVPVAETVNVFAWSVWLSPDVAVHTYCFPAVALTGDAYEYVIDEPESYHAV